LTSDEPVETVNAFIYDMRYLLKLRIISKQYKASADELIIDITPLSFLLHHRRRVRVLRELADLHLVPLKTLLPILCRIGKIVNKARSLLQEYLENVVNISEDEDIDPLHLLLPYASTSCIANLRHTVNFPSHTIHFDDIDEFLLCENNIWSMLSQLRSFEGLKRALVLATNSL